MNNMGTVQVGKKQANQNINKVQKINISSFYNQNFEYQTQKKEQSRDEVRKISKQILFLSIFAGKFKEILSEKIIQINELKNHAWYGIPTDYRSLTWKILLKYQSPNKDAQFSTLDRKRSQYYEMCGIYFEQQGNFQLYDDREKKIIKLISDDVKRTLPDAKMFRNTILQSIMERILFIWNIRNPACGYVQGINDIVTPFLTIFLSDYVDIDTDSMSFINEQQIDHLDVRLLKQIEADSYWCLNKLLESVVDNYTSHQPGLARFHKRLKEILLILDKPLLDHFEEQCRPIIFYRNFLQKLTFTALSSSGTIVYYCDYSHIMSALDYMIPIWLKSKYTFLDYFEFCLFVVASILMKFSKKLKQMAFEEIMFLMEKMPTKGWSEEDLNLCLAEAYSYKMIFMTK